MIIFIPMYASNRLITIKAKLSVRNILDISLFVHPCDFSVFRSFWQCFMLVFIKFVNKSIASIRENMLRYFPVDLIVFMEKFFISKSSEYFVFASVLALSIG